MVYMILKSLNVQTNPCCCRSKTANERWGIVMFLNLYVILSFFLAFWVHTRLTHYLLKHQRYSFHVSVVYHVTIVAIGHGLLKKFWPMMIGCVLRTALPIQINLDPASWPPLQLDQPL